jgi:hypothetical protein
MLDQYPGRVSLVTETIPGTQRLLSHITLRAWAVIPNSPPAGQPFPPGTGALVLQQLRPASPISATEFQNADRLVSRVCVLGFVPKTEQNSEASRKFCRFVVA